MAEPELSLGYITTGYPYVSHTFIQNEVLALRGLGVHISTFAVRREPRCEIRTRADQNAWETTYALRPPSPVAYLQAHLRALRQRPRAYARALKVAVSLAGPAPSDLARHAAYFVQAVVLWDRLRRKRISHVHAHFANVASDLALLAAVVGDGELTWGFTMHGPTEFYEVRHYRLREKVRAAAMVVCISAYCKSQLMALSEPEQWKKLSVIHCGVDVERFSPAAKPRSDSKVRIASVGRMVPEKGQALLIEAIVVLRERGIDAELVLAGDGPERATLSSLVKRRGLSGHVRFEGAVGHDRVVEVLRDSDLFCLPSFAEGVPIVLMEAMAMELPVVACNVMGIPELIENEVCGLLVAPGSVTEIRDALTRLASDTALHRRVAAAGRAKVVDQFDQRTSARRLRATFAGVFATRHE